MLTVINNFSYQSKTRKKGLNTLISLADAFFAYISEDVHGSHTVMASMVSSEHFLQQFSFLSLLTIIN